MHPLQEAAKKAASKELEQSKKDEKQRADSKAAASCARIKHIWQLEPTEREFKEDAKRMLLKVEEFIELKCQTMADMLYEQDDLRRALRSRSTALDGARS